MSTVFEFCLLMALLSQGSEPIRLHPDNPRWFLWRGEAVALITSAEHYGAVLNLDFDYVRYLDTLQRDGMNYTRVFAGSYVEPQGAFGIQRNTLAPAPGRFRAPWARSDQPGYAGGGNKFDLDRFNPDYLARLDVFITEAGILNFHYAYPETVDWNRGWNRVIGYDESGFAGREDATYRRQAWNFVLSGGGLLNSLDYSFTVGREDGTDVANEAPGGGSPRLRRQLGVLSRFLHGFDLAKLNPDGTFVVRAPGVVTRVLSDPGNAYAIYVQGRSPTTLTVQLPAGRWAVKWSSAEDGRSLKEESVSSEGKQLNLESPKFGGDVALRIVSE